jgi:hypothetical protein
MGEASSSDMYQSTKLHGRHIKENRDLKFNVTITLHPVKYVKIQNEI